MNSSFWRIVQRAMSAAGRRAHVAVLPRASAFVGRHLNETVRAADGADLPAHSIAMLLVWACYTGIMFMSLLLFLQRENIQPIKSRSPRLVAVSCVGGWLVLTNNAFANWATGLADWPCPFSLWVVWFARLPTNCPLRQRCFLDIFHLFCMTQIGVSFPRGKVVAC